MRNVAPKKILQYTDRCCERSFVMAGTASLFSPSNKVLLDLWGSSGINAQEVPMVGGEW